MSKLSDILKTTGRSKNEPADKFDKEQLSVGIQIEKEHTGNDEQAAAEIAKDHLREDPNYYKNLSKIEKEVKKAEKKSTKPSVVRDILHNIK